jgi:ABC-2 type transport system permease protein
VFGREYADHTAKEIMTVPTARSAIVAAKFALTALWMAGLAVLVYGRGLAVGAAVEIPGWSAALAWSTFGSFLAVAVMSYGLSTFVAFFASAGRGFLPALAWSILLLLAAQIISVLGWGDWFPWAVPGLLSNAAGAEAAAGLGVHSYVLVALTFAAGVAATLGWWWRADQVR